MKQTSNCQSMILPVLTILYTVTFCLLSPAFTRAQEQTDTPKQPNHQIFLPMIASEGGATVESGTTAEVESKPEASNDPSQDDELVDEAIFAQPSAEMIAAAQASGKTTGIWYSTWYANKGKYIWSQGHGQGSNRQMLEDVNGDGKADAVTYFGNDGSWYVALSNGKGFNAYSRWIAGHGVGSSMQVLRDVNGDNKSDSVVYFGNEGSWWVALSSGSKFNGYSRWITGHGVGSSNQLLRDVNGDKKADAVVYFGNEGSWWVALSSGSGFNAYSRWITGHGVGSSQQLLSDVTGDGKADAVVYFGNEGSWWAATSTGNGFNGYTRWITGHGITSTAQLLEDITGDGKADAVVYFGQEGRWYAANATGSAFNGYYHWKEEHGKYRHDANTSTWQGLGKVYGDNKAAPVAFYNNGGLWKALPADNYFKPNMLNTWEAWNIKYLPYTLGQYRTYDTTEATVIDEHLRLIAAAQIDFLIFDETNYIETDGGYIKAGAQAVCQRIKAWNAVATNRPIKYAVAIGWMQLTHDPQSMEDESAIVWRDFVNYCSANNYYYLNGKPLLISYVEYNDRIQWQNWNGNKANSNQFTVRWTQGKLPANLGVTVPASDYGLYFGWGYPQGALANADVMVVMPGWNNQVGDFVSRSYNGVEGDFYKLLGWQRVLTQQPRIVVINSFNEYAEQTAVAPTKTSNVVAPSEKWKSVSFYWDMTRTYNLQYKR